MALNPYSASPYASYAGAPLRNPYGGYDNSLYYDGVGAYGGGGALYAPQYVGMGGGMPLVPTTVPTYNYDPYMMRGGLGAGGPTVIVECDGRYHGSSYRYPHGRSGRGVYREWEERYPLGRRSRNGYYHDRHRGRHHDDRTEYIEYFNGH